MLCKTNNSSVGIYNTTQFCKQYSLQALSSSVFENIVQCWLYCTAWNYSKKILLVTFTIWCPAIPISSRNYSFRCKIYHRAEQCQFTLVIHVKKHCFALLWLWKSHDGQPRKLPNCTYPENKVDPRQFGSLRPHMIWCSKTRLQVQWDQHAWPFLMTKTSRKTIYDF